MKIYIAGKITGMKRLDVNIVFTRAHDYIEELGNEVINPLEITKHLPDGTEWVEYMAVCIPALLECDAIYMLNNWEDSEGAKLEHALAKSTGMKIFYQP